MAYYPQTEAYILHGNTFCDSPMIYRAEDGPDYKYRRQLQKVRNAKQPAFMPRDACAWACLRLRMPAPGDICGFLQMLADGTFLYRPCREF